jgi:histidyl-tRNA synthetase
MSSSSPTSSSSPQVKSGQRFQTPIGTHDLLPEQSARWLAFNEVFARQSTLANFGLIETPMFEDLGVFRRIGEGTDVVTKEMYDFVDKGNRHMALRPENTAAVCRAFVQHRPTPPWKVWYNGPFFRYEAPQAGRLRQFHQVGAEILGSADPDADVEIIALAARTLRELGLRRALLLINSMGDVETRRTYAAAVQAYLTDRIDEIDPADRAKVDVHPLRVLDSKREATRSVTADAPKVGDYLTPEAVDHFDRVQAGLGALGIDFAIEPRLVRGLDYYTHTLFEFQSSALDNAQNTVCGGGRYNGLVEELGGPDTPGVGFAMGIERTLLACDAENTFPAPDVAPRVFVVDVTGGDHARDITAELRELGIRSDRAFDQRSMRSQMKAADRSGALWAVIVGSDEVAAGVVTVRNLRAGDDQRTVKRSDVASDLAQLLNS